MNTQDRQAIVDAIYALEPLHKHKEAQALRDLLSAQRALLRAKPAMPWGVMLLAYTEQGLPDCSKFGIVACVDWLDAERTAEHHWSDRTVHQHVMVYDLDIFFYWLAKWIVPATAFDNTLPQVPV